MPSGRLQRIAYALARGPFSRAMTPGIRWRIEGAERIPRGGAMLVCNHASDADPAVLMRALPDPVGFLAAPFMGKLPIFRTLLRKSGSVAIGSNAPQPWRAQVVQLLQSGNKLVVFPEGQTWLLAQDFTAPLASFHPGFAAFAYTARVPVVPLVIERVAYDIVPFKTGALVRWLSGNPQELVQTKRVLRHRACVVHVLAPIEVERFADRPKDEAVPWLIEQTRARMQAALDSYKARSEHAAARA
jgi:1-acyl-sn-glycerol-3-phosphate acyltransferase